MIRPALIFDFGNVVAFFDFEKATTRLGARLGLSGRELLDQLRPVGLGTLLQAYERGKLSSVQFSEQFLGLIQLAVTHDEFAAAWTDIFTANESIIPVIADLKRQGYRLLLGSNTNDLHAIRFRDQFAATLAYFDALVLSYEVGEIKPHRDFFRACAAAAAMEPGDCVFIDDLAENIAGARAAGLVGIVYRTTADLLVELSRLGIIVEPAPDPGGK